jgi:hypothetical protein
MAIREWQVVHTSTLPGIPAGNRLEKTAGRWHFPPSCFKLFQNQRHAKPALIPTVATIACRIAMQISLRLKNHGLIPPLVPPSAAVGQDGGIAPGSGIAILRVRVENGLRVARAID